MPEKNRHIKQIELHWVLPVNVIGVFVSFYDFYGFLKMNLRHSCVLAPPFPSRIFSSSTFVKLLLSIVLLLLLLPLLLQLVLLLLSLLLLLLIPSFDFQRFVFFLYIFSYLLSIFPYLLWAVLFVTFLPLFFTFFLK